MIDEKYKALNGKRVVVVDDTPANIFSMKICLSPYGVSMIPFESGAEAIAWIEENPHKVDLVLMDMRMPGMDGREAIGRVRQISEVQQVPIIAVTAQAMTGDREICMAAGADEYVSKPVHMPELLDKMLSFVGKEAA